MFSELTCSAHVYSEVDERIIIFYIILSKFVRSQFKCTSDIDNFKRLRVIYSALVLVNDHYYELVSVWIEQNPPVPISKLHNG